LGIPLSDVAESVRSELNKIWEKPLRTRSEPLQLLRKKINSYGIPFFNQFLKGLYTYSKLAEKRKGITKELEYVQKKAQREKLVEMTKETKYLLGEAKKKLDLLDIPEEYKEDFEDLIRTVSYYATTQEFWQQAIVSMYEGDYDEAEDLAEKGLEEAKNRGNSRNINQFAGLKFECKAFRAFVDKRWWEINSKDFTEAVKGFQEALDCYVRAEATEKITSVPLALINILQFIASPTFDNLTYLVEFGELRDRYPTIAHAFRPARSSISERHRLRDLIMQFLGNVAYKIAAFNIFEEFRTMVVELENFAWKTDQVYREVKRKIPDRASLYNTKHAPSIENFVDDCTELFGKDLPESIIMLKDIYHDCKHKKIYINYTPEPDKFAEELVNRVISSYEVLKGLRDDMGQLKALFMRHS